MGKGSAPTPPNPMDTAKAQTGTNVATSISNAFLNNVNQTTPDGSLRYDVTGNYQWQDPYTGQSISIPTFSATQSLSPQQQAIKDQTDAAKFNMAGLANNASGNLSNLLSKPMDFSGAPTAGDASTIANAPMAQTSFADVGSQQRTFGDAGPITKTYGAGDFSQDRSKVEEALYGRLNPQLQKDRANIEQRLADQGIRYGSQAYTSAMDDYNRQSNDARLGVTVAGGQEQQRMMDMARARGEFENTAQQQEYTQQGGRASFANAAQAADYSQAAGRGEFANSGLAQQLAQKQAGFNAANTSRSQWMGEQYAQRNQPINEISALMSGSQVSNPNFVSTNNYNIPTTDVAGIIGKNFDQQMEGYKQESANSNALMGGLFGMAGGMMKMSDERTKDNIVPMATVFAAADDDDVAKPLPIYQYSYKDDPSKQQHVGPMAQDVEKIEPKAVKKDRRGIRYIDQRKVMGNIMKVA